MYQVRGVDLSNITFIAGATGWIVIDPLTASETAAFALDLLHAHFPARPVVAVIYTHSHVDHFGGVRGVTTDEAVARGRRARSSPRSASSRPRSRRTSSPARRCCGGRRTCTAGCFPVDPLGHVDCGLGKAIPLLGTSGLIAPTVEITHTGEERVVDGVRLRFQYTPDTEAPAEMNIDLPDRRLLCMAENCSSTLHNVYTPRGAQIRDALAWSKYINESIELFGGDHRHRVHEPPLAAVRQRGRRPVHGGAARHLPLDPRRDDAARQPRRDRARDRGDARAAARPRGPRPRPRLLRHAQPQREGRVPALPRLVRREPGAPAAAPARGRGACATWSSWAGSTRCSRRCRRRSTRATTAGPRRCSTTRCSPRPSATDVKLLQADVLEQLGYRAESGPWRDFYLTGAQELRHGAPHLGGSMASSVDVLRAMTTEMLVDLMAVRLDGARADAARCSTSRSPTRGDRGVVGLDHGALRFTAGPPRRRRDGRRSRSPTSALARLASGHVDARRARRRGDGHRRPRRAGRPPRHARPLRRRASRS